MLPGATFDNVPGVTFDSNWWNDVVLGAAWWWYSCTLATIENLLCSLFSVSSTSSASSTSSHRPQMNLQFMLGKGQHTEQAATYLKEFLVGVCRGIHLPSIHLLKTLLPSTCILHRIVSHCILLYFIFCNSHVNSVTSVVDYKIILTESYFKTLWDFAMLRSWIGVLCGWVARYSIMGSWGIGATDHEEIKRMDYDNLTAGDESPSRITITNINRPTRQFWNTKSTYFHHNYS